MYITSAERISTVLGLITGPNPASYSKGPL